MTSIRFRLPAVLGGLTFLICAMMAVSFWSTQMADRAMTAVLTDRLIPLRDLKAISDAYAVDIVDTSHKVRGGSFTFAKGIESVGTSEKVIADRWTAYLQNTLGEEEKKLVAEAKVQKVKTDAGVRKLMSMLNAGQLADIASFNDRQLYPIIEPMTAVIDKLVNFHIVEAELEARNVAKTAALTLTALWVGLACTIAFVDLAMRVVFRDVLGPIERLTRSVSAIGEGNLEASVPDQARRDEVGRMARIVESLRLGSRELRSIENERHTTHTREIARRDALLASIRSFAAHVNTTVTLVNESADAIRTTSGVMTESAGETAQRASSAEMSLNGNTEAIQSMSAATSQLSSAIEEVSSQGRAIVQSIENMAARTGKAGTRLDQLNDIAGKAQAAVDLIASVADQTNLLALNATIEAARAGEAGRGFAVVAGEVKTLAAQAARATADIRGLIASMNDTAGALQDAMAEVLGGVGDLKAVATFVKDAVDEQSKSTAAISRSIEETAQASSHILTDVQTMSRSAQETGDAAQGVSTIAVDLVTAARKLDDEMMAFAERMKAA